MNTQRFSPRTFLPNIKQNKTNDFHVFEGKLTDLDTSQLHCIYHHLNQGIKVSLKRLVKHSKSRIAVFFKGFLIGYLPQKCNETLFEMLDREFLIQSSIVCIERKKYLAPSSITIRITA